MEIIKGAKKTQGAKNSILGCKKNNMQCYYRNQHW